MIETMLLPYPEFWPTAALAALIGLLVGSFLNVVIHRVPKMMEREIDNFVADRLGKEPVHTDSYNLMVPRSACPHCNHQITALENVPVISYLAIRGKCSSCKAPISKRYPTVELITGLLSGFAVWHFGAGLIGLGAVVFVWFLIAMTFIDFDTSLLPDDLTLPLIWLGLLINTQGTFTSLQDAVIGAALGYVALWLVFWLFKLVTGKDGMGYGDFKLLAALGAWMGWAMLPVIILLSSLVGSIVGITMIVFAKHRREIPIPFGPYLAGAGFIAMFWGKPLIQAYLGN
jgi:leader peptidase (prepilin peptidase) / N-methyltransferase